MLNFKQTPEIFRRNPSNEPNFTRGYSAGKLSLQSGLSRVSSLERRSVVAFNPNGS